jgi:small subunit ribosomal protein S3
MGQKVNPISMRLQVNKDWRSKWFVDKRDYAKYLKDDLTVRKLIQQKVGQRGAVNKVDIERSPNLVTVTITTARAGVIIGRGGSGAQELKAAIEKVYGVPVRVNIEEIKKPELYAKLVAEMSRREKEVAGSVPLHTLRADIDYANVAARTPAGIIGVKVWIYKGEVQ